MSLKMNDVKHVTAMLPEQKSSRPAGSSGKDMFVRYYNYYIIK